MQVEGEAFGLKPAHGCVTRIQSAFYPGDSPKKFGLIPYGIRARHRVLIKATAVKDEYAFY